MAITINNNIVGFDGKEMIILKAYIYRKTVALRTGESYNRYMTMFTMVPKHEFTPSVELFKSDSTTSPYNGRPMTHGVFVKLIGSMEGLIFTQNRVILSDYQKHVETNGWKFMQTVPGVKGGDFETIRRQAFVVIQKLKKNDKKMN